MPDYNFKCTVCENDFEHKLSFAEFDKVKCENNTFLVDCPNCESMVVTISYDKCPHSHVVNTNNVGVFMEKNAKKVGQVKIQEAEAKKEEALVPKGKEAWYGRLSKDKAKEIFNSRNNKQTQKEAAKKYIFEGK